MAYHNPLGQQPCFMKSRNFSKFSFSVPKLETLAPLPIYVHKTIVNQGISLLACDCFLNINDSHTFFQDFKVLLISLML